MKQYASILVLLLTVTSGVWAGSMDECSFNNQQQEQQYKKPVKELRCLVCQNQNLADSNAELAQDLRNEIYGMIKKGMDDKQSATDFKPDAAEQTRLQELLRIMIRNPVHDQFCLNRCCHAGRGNSCFASGLTGQRQA
ncbi:MAG: cytochrome c-type biogenesis protein CcmH [Gammaproteobacteria bacterium]|nr:cytochrome c-type biogenesis protein CcmH [Gammaproteobacteria bacterium]